MHAAKTELAPERRAIEGIKRKATAMAIVDFTETSFVDEVEAEPDLEADLELHLRGRSCGCPATTSGATAKRTSGSATPAGTSYRHA
jgi:hypothetical protein